MTQSAASRALTLEKNIKQAKREVQEFTAEKNGCISSIKNSVTLIQVEWGKMERYAERAQASSDALAKMEAELEKVRRNVNKESLQDKRATLMAELRELDALEGKKV